MGAKECEFARFLVFMNPATDLCVCKRLDTMRDVLLVSIAKCGHGGEMGVVDPLRRSL